MREETVDPDRFAFELDARGMIPRWFLVIWDVFILAVVALGVATLQLSAVIAFPVVGAAMIGGIRLFVWMLSNPNWNSVELKMAALHIVMGRAPLLMWRRLPWEVPYTSIGEIRENALHSFWPVWVWPHKPVPPHIDLVLSGPVTMPGFYSWVNAPKVRWIKVLHLDVADPQRFVQELKLAARPWVRL